MMMACFLSASFRRFFRSALSRSSSRADVDALVVLSQRLSLASSGIVKLSRSSNSQPLREFYIAERIAAE
jgi:hypothetical protein